MESWGNWGSVCVLQKDKEVERKRKNENEWGIVILMKY